MALRQILRSHHSQTLLQLKNPSQNPSVKRKEKKEKNEGLLRNEPKSGSSSLSSLFGNGGKKLELNAPKEKKMENLESVWKSNENILELAVAMRIISLYALESVPPQLLVPEEIKASVSRLLKEAVNLSQTVS
ncbi:hypothetical protein ACH5RR_028188 [Cinchona calisaya]|uniref:Uncharacterized protein n=1 Tax=Cinchona calisaya TaxID=153742 RepID=A0ABD2YSH8_9GENT